MQLAEDTLVDGRYKVLSRIGSGGMADVWCAEDTLLGRRVALKVLHERFAQDREFVERFRREASAAAGLQHPNVVAVFDRGELDGTYYIAMEYVEGSSLKDLIVGGALSIASGLRIIRQVLAAARFAHERGIVHRDLKPHNVLVDREGHASVTDFGIARAGHSEITQTGSVMGTAQYLSPEQAQGLEVTPASDIYSIGVMLYEALTGRVPFEGDSAVAVALKQISEQPKPPSRLNPTVPAALDSVLLKALAKDPANRFGSADEFLRALDAAEADPNVALGQTAAYAPVPAPVPAPVAEEAAAAPTEPPAEPPPAAKRKRPWRWIALGVLALLAAGLAIWALTRPEQVSVPDVTGQQEEQAEAVLAAAGFEVEVRRFPRDAPVGTVVEQDPVAGDEAEEGSTVTLSVSSGLGKADVPDVTGLPIRDAVRKLKDEGFRSRQEEEFSSEVDAGLVIRTDPAAGVREDRGETVTVVVSKGLDLVAVPDVLGQSEGSAEAHLEQAGFIVDVDSTESDAEEGTVVEQVPGGGSEIERGSDVTIVVSEGPGAETVPGVIGKKREGAIRVLQNQGFSVRVSSQETSDESEDDRVIDQFPAAGTQAEPGTEVTISVGSFVEPEPPPPEEPKGLPGE